MRGKFVRKTRYAHCWVELTIGDVPYILDITATQFGEGLPKVLLIPKSDEMAECYVDGKVTRTFPFWQRSVFPFALNDEKIGHQKWLAEH